MNTPQCHVTRALPVLFPLAELLQQQEALKHIEHKSTAEKSGMACTLVTVQEAHNKN